MKSFFQKREGRYLLDAGHPARFEDEKGTVDLRIRRNLRRALVVVGCFTAIVVLGFVSFYSSGRAEIEQFNPSSCLGTWENSHLAASGPETEDGSVEFSEENSARYAALGAEIFCGGFITETREDEFKVTRAVLSFVWQGDFQKPEELPQEEPEAETGVEDESEAASSTEEESIEPDPPSEHFEEQTAPVEQEEQESAGPEQEETSSRGIKGYIAGIFLKLAQAQEEGALPPQEEAPAPTPPESSETPPEQETVPQESGSEEAPAEETQEPEVSEEPAESVSEPSDEPPVIEEVTEEVVVLPPVVVELAPIEEPENEEVFQEEQAVTDPEAGPEESEEETALPAPEPLTENFFEIEYSTDGANWFQIGTVSPDNISDLTIPIPLSSWDDLARLQVRVRGIETSLSPLPEVLLDSMVLEVEYEAPMGGGPSEEREEEEEGGGDEEGIMEFIADALGLSRPSEPSIETEPEAPRDREEISIFDPRAKHECRIEPFVQMTAPGRTVTYGIEIVPHDISRERVIEIPSLPTGITASVEDDSFSITASESAVKGSFSIIVLYKENYSDAGMLPNFCQFNLVVE